MKSTLQSLPGVLFTSRQNVNLHSAVYRTCVGQGISERSDNAHSKLITTHLLFAVHTDISGGGKSGNLVE